MNLRLRVAVVGGHRISILDTEPPEDGPPDVREGFARRAIANGGGTCPCGARWALPNRATRRAANRKGRPITIAVEHASDCPAADANLTTAIDRWRSA